MSSSPENQNSHIISLVERESGRIEKMLPIQTPKLAIRLYAYTFFSQYPYPSAENRSMFTKTCRKLVRDEQLHEPSEDLYPTIGVEYHWTIPRKPEEILKKLGVQVVSADDEDPDGPLREVVLPWTHNAITQNFMLQQLRLIGALPSEASEGNVSADHPLLHVSLGIPQDITPITLTESEPLIESFVDVLALAYGSPADIAHLPTTQSHTSLKEADVIRSSATDDLAYRLELLMLTYDENTIGKLLQNIQVLGIGLFARMRENNVVDRRSIQERPAYLVELTIIDYFTSLLKIASDREAQHNIPLDFAGMQDKRRVAEILEQNSTLSSSMRRFVTNTCNSILYTLEHI